MSLPGYINKTLLHSLTLDGTQAFQYNEFKPELEAKVKPVFLLFFLVTLFTVIVANYMNV